MFQVSQPRPAKFKRHSEAPLGEKNPLVYDVLDKDGKILLTYYSKDRAAAVVAYLNKMAETRVKED